MAPNGSTDKPSDDRYWSTAHCDPGLLWPERTACHSTRGPQVVGDFETQRVEREEARPWRLHAAEWPPHQTMVVRYVENLLAACPPVGDQTASNSPVDGSVRRKARAPHFNLLDASVSLSDPAARQAALP